MKHNVRLGETLHIPLYQNNNKNSHIKILLRSGCPLTDYLFSAWKLAGLVRLSDQMIRHWRPLKTPVFVQMHL